MVLPTFSAYSGRKQDSWTLKGTYWVVLGGIWSEIFLPPFLCLLSVTVYFLGILSVSLSFSFFSCLHWSQLSEFHLGNLLFHLFTLKKKNGFHVFTSLSWLRTWILKTDYLGQIYYHTGCVILGKFNFPLCQSLHLQNGDNNNTSEGCSDAKWKYTCKVGNKGDPLQRHLQYLKALWPTDVTKFI